MATEDEMDVEAQHFTMEVDRPVNTLNPITPPSTPTDPASDIPTTTTTQALENPIQSSSSSSSKDPHLPSSLSTTSTTQPQTPPPHSHPNPFLQHPHSQLLSSARRAVADVLAKCSADLLLPDCSHVVLIDGDVKLRQGLLALLENGVKEAAVINTRTQDLLGSLSLQDMLPSAISSLTGITPCGVRWLHDERTDQTVYTTLLHAEDMQPQNSRRLPSVAANAAMLSVARELQLPDTSSVAVVNGRSILALVTAVDVVQFVRARVNGALNSRVEDVGFGTVLRVDVGQPLGQMLQEVVSRGLRKECVAVVDAVGRLVGSFELGLVPLLMERGFDGAVGEVMRNPISVGVEDGFQAVLERLCPVDSDQDPCQGVFVVDEANRVLGVIEPRDVLRFFLERD